MPPSKTIAVVGASARAAAFSLLRSGHQVVAADLFADVDLARACDVTRIASYLDEFERWLAQTECDAWMYTGALENYPDLIDRMAALSPLVGHAGDVVRRVRDPLELQRVLSGAGFAFPETVVANDRSAIEPEWLAKSYQGSCGSGVGRDDATYHQRFVAGTPLSAVFRGPQLLGATRQLVGEAWIGAGEFQYCGTLAPWPVSSDARASLQQLGALLSNEFRLTELYGIDLIDDCERLWTIEVNPRYTAAVEVVERATGQSVFDRTTFSPASYCGKVVLYAKMPLVVTEATSSLLLEQNDHADWPTVADIPNAGTMIEAGQPICTLLTEADSCAAVEQRLRERVTATEHQLYPRTVPCV